MAKFTIPSVFTAVDKFSGPVDKMGKTAESSFAKVERKVNKIGQQAFSVAKKTALIGASIALPLIAAANQAVKFEDKLADVGKTTGLQGEKLNAFGDEIINLSKNTRTSIDDLATIGEIGGQLGVSEDKLLSFVDAADKFNIALGADFGSVDEAVSQVGKIKNLFADTRDLDIADVINKVGSSINTLGAIGSGTSGNITDFTLRIGALPDALKPSVQEAIALGTAFEEVGISSKIGASGLSKLLITAAKDLTNFGAQMHMTGEQAKILLESNPAKFAQSFASSFEGLGPEELSKSLAELGLNSNEVIKVIGALGSQTERLDTLTQESNKSFKEGNSLAEEAATKNATNAAKMEILKNQVQGVAIKLGNALLPIISELADAVVPLIDRFSSWIEKNPALVSSIARLAVKAIGLLGAISAVSFAIGGLTKLFKIAKAVQTAYNVVQAITGAITGKVAISVGKNKVALAAYTITTKIATIAQRALAFAQSLTPWGLALVAVGAVAGALVAYAASLGAATKAEELSNEVKNRAVELAGDQIADTKILFATLKNTKVGTEEYIATLSKIEQIQPGITAQYNLQAGALDDINRAEKDLTKSILQRAMAEASAELIREKTKQAFEALNRENTFNENLALKVGALTEEDISRKKKQEAAGFLNEANILAEQASSIQQSQREDAVNLPADQQAVTNESIQTEKQTLKLEASSKLLELLDIKKEGGSNSGMSMPSVPTTN